jgi:RNA:NAD 2'-phosphotransferase (TPT1/KptA family)
VNVDDLLFACAVHQFPITRAELEEVVATSDKQRFLLSMKLELGFEPIKDIVLTLI